jgi:hypothetical protein
MLHRLRRDLRVLAAAVLVSSSTVGGLSTLGHGLDHHDADDGPAIVVHDASAHAFRNAAPAAGDRPVHCVLCHWTRAFGPGVEFVSLTHVVTSRTLAAQAGDSGLTHSFAAVQPPLRAPPAPRSLDAFA